MKSLSLFRSRIAPRVDGCSDIIIDQSVLDSAIDFCNQSLVVKRMMFPVQTVAGRSEYDIEPGVVSIQRVWVDAKEIQPLGEDALAGPYAFISSVPGQTPQSGSPRSFAQPYPGVISLYPIPDSVYTLSARVALAPTRSATQVEDQLWDDWAEAITDGALARLYMYPGAWSSAALSKYHSQLFLAAVNAAMLEASQGINRAELRITPVHI